MCLFHDRHSSSKTPKNLIESTLSVGWLLILSLRSMSGFSPLFYLAYGK